MVKPGPGDSGFNGIGSLGGDQLAFSLRMTSPGEYMGVQINQPLGGRTLAHELGHNYGFRPTGCGTSSDESGYPYDPCSFSVQEADGHLTLYGFDTMYWYSNATTVHSRVSIAPPAPTQRLGDLMSYSPLRWASDWTWNRLYVGLSPRLAIQDERVEPAAGAYLILTSLGDSAGDVAAMEELMVADTSLLPA